MAASHDSVHDLGENMHAGVEAGVPVTAGRCNVSTQTHTHTHTQSYAYTHACIHTNAHTRVHIQVLGGDDVYILSDAPLSADRGVHTLYVVCAAQFLCDLVVRTVVEPGFRGSFFFWLELVALISIAPEVI